MDSQEVSFERLIEALDSFRIADPRRQDRAVGRIALGGTFYYSGAGQPEKRAAIGTFLDRFVEDVGGSLTWYSVPDGDPGAYRAAPARQSPPPSYREMLGRTSPQEPAAAAVGSAGPKSPDWSSAAGSHLLETVLPASYNPLAPGLVRFHLPFSWESAVEETRLWDLVWALCSSTQPLHGTAGMVLALPLEERVAYAAAEQGAFAEVIAAYPGMDATPTQYALGAPPRLFSINWLTAVSDRILQDLDPPLDQASMNDGVIVERYEGGVLIQAGPAPLPAFGANGIPPPAYRKVAALLKGIRREVVENPIAGPDEGSWQRYTQRFD